MQSRYFARIYFIILFVISMTESHIFNFMTLNLFLAYVPFELCLLLKLFKPVKAFEWPLFIVFGLIFLLLVPNTFYMITDLIHLNQFQFNFLAGLNITEWIYFTYLILGVLLAIYLTILIFFRNCTFYVLCMVKSTIDSYINVLKWIRYLHRSILKITYCLFIKCTFKNCERGFF